MFVNDTKSTWIAVKEGSSNLTYKGDKAFALQTLEIIDCSNAENLTKLLEEHFKNQHDFTSGVAETETHIVAWVDHIRSWPLFYNNNMVDFKISQNARECGDYNDANNVDLTSSIEFAMSGYVTGNRTLCKDIFCIQPGEFITLNKKDKQLNTHRYFQYLPQISTDAQDTVERIAELNTLLDQITLKVIDKAQGRPIWIPLSGGLDCRIILCKLHEHGYKNLNTFTYGPKYNFEALHAKRVAKALNVPWVFVSPNKNTLRRYFNSDERKAFWKNTDGLKAISSMREFAALMHLRAKKLLPDNAILINGQSGDYITGGHISAVWGEQNNFTPSDLYSVLFNKHYALWKKLKTPYHEQILQNRIQEILPDNWTSAQTAMDGAELEEAWEYDGRQICLVANGQRSYDFFNYDWEMPLWDKALVNFCQTLSMPQKKGQALYKKYLQQYNYKNLFPAQEPHIWRWPLTMLWVVPCAKIIEKLRGKKAKKDFYALMRYYGHYSNQFYSFPWKIHKKTHLDTRSVMSLNVRQWALENRHFFSKNLLQGMKINDVD